MRCVATKDKGSNDFSWDKKLNTDVEGYQAVRDDALFIVRP